MGGLLASIFESVAVAFEVDDLGVVDEAVDHGGDGDGVAEDLGPGGERLVRADDQAGAFVAGRDQGEEQAGGFGVEGDVADLVDDQQRDPAESVEFGVEPAGPLGGGQAVRPTGGRWRRRPGDRGGRPGRRGRSTGGSCRCRAGRRRSRCWPRARKSSWARWSTTCLLDAALEAEVEVVEGLDWPGSRAALTRCWPPWVSRAATSSSSTRAR